MNIDLQNLSGKRALITGGTTGIGRATAMLLASQGVRVFIFGRDGQALDDALAEIEGVGEVYGITADVTKKEDIEKVFQAVDEKLGGLDILVNDAGLGGGSLNEENFEEWKYLLETNVLGYMACTKYAVERMQQNGTGEIVFIGSMSADTRDPGAEVYNASKAAVQAFAESMRKVLNPKGIRVTLIEPGAVGSDMQSTTPEEERQKQSEGTMLKAEDIASAILYCIQQPARCDVISMQVRPTKQAI